MHSPICKWCNSIVAYAMLRRGTVAPLRLGTFRVLRTTGGIIGGARILHSSECPKAPKWVDKPWSNFCVPGQDSPEGDPICR